MEDFPPRYEKGGKRRTHCIACMRYYQRRYAERKGIHKARYESRKSGDPRAYVLMQIRARANTRGIPCDLEVGDIQIPECCPVFGMPLVRPGSSRKGTRDAAPSVDRLDPTKGYVKGNVAVISLKANRLKNNATAEELEKIAAWMRSQAKEHETA